jgi:trehalose 6-phosphate synthase/phosphatase
MGDLIQPNEASEDTANRVVVVSNRLPFTLVREDRKWTTRSSTGGLATAMTPVLERNGGIWIGWSGDSSPADDPERSALLAEWEKENGYIAVDIPPEIVRGYYEGFSNEVLWFLFHSFPGMVKFDTGDWRDYVKANEKFRDVLVSHLKPGDLIWIHDYQLMLLPELVREAVPDARIGFFLHIPFPPSDVFRVLPRREEILNGLLGADYIAFHTHRYLQNFRSSLLRIVGQRTAMDHISVGNRKIQLQALPIGIDTLSFNEILRSQETTDLVRSYRERYRGQKVLVGVDRIDITKGLPERLRAYRKFLQRNRRSHGKVVLVQVAVPSRENISNYQELQKQVDELVGQINGRYGTPDWSPIVYIRRGLEKEELTALYAIADVALVTPLRDGQNLVAKEYVACKPDGDGVLILSEFAGAAAEMGEALQVNPYDEDQVAKTIGRALTMRTEERGERMRALYNRVARNSVFTWGERFVSNLMAASEHRSAHLKDGPEPLPREDALSAYAASSRRLILLDYDGTLVPYTNLAKNAIPPRDLLQTLAKLAADDHNKVVVVSGRSKTELERWFGHIRDLWIAAEHGAVFRSPVTKDWLGLHANLSVDWKKEIATILESYADLTPGSYIEEKEYSLVWHYRMSEPEFGEWLANELNSTLDAMLADTELRAVRGRKNVEVKLIWASKADILLRMIADNPEFDFVLAAGDDVTDEDLFAQMDDRMWSIHVGDRPTEARFCLENFADIRTLLGRFVEVSLGQMSAEKAAGRH